MRVELLFTLDCPNAPAARAVLGESLERLGVAVAVQDVGDYPSPTILVDGVDVMTGRPNSPSAPACRLDAPTRSRVVTALRARITNRTDGDAE